MSDLRQTEIDYRSISSLSLIIRL